MKTSLAVAYRGGGSGGGGVQHPPSLGALTTVLGMHCGGTQKPFGMRTGGTKSFFWMHRTHKNNCLGIRTGITTRAPAPPCRRTMLAAGPGDKNWPRWRKKFWRRSFGSNLKKRNPPPPNVFPRQNTPDPPPPPVHANSVSAVRTVNKEPRVFSCSPKCFPLSRCANCAICIWGGSRLARAAAAPGMY